MKDKEKLINIQLIWNEGGEYHFHSELKACFIYD